MPRGDRRGPNGMGQMTGRSAGFCSGSNAPGFANTGAVGGYGQGMGRGFQQSYAAPVYSKETEKGFIETEVSFLKDQLKALEGRLAGMQKDE